MQLDYYKKIVDMSKILIFAFVSILFSFSCISCTSTSQGRSSIEDEDLIDTTQLPLEAQKANKLFYSLPTSHEIISILIDHPDTKYDISIISKADAQRYNTTAGRALNIGIYGTDMCYSSLFEQNPQVLKYMSAIKKMSEQLGLLQIFNEETLQKMQDNISKKDSMVAIVTKTFYESDAYLIENGQHETAAMILAGAWLEGHYVALKLTKEDIAFNRKLSTRVLKQLGEMSLMTDYLEKYKEDVNVGEVYGDFSTLKTIVDNANIKENDGELVCDAEIFKQIAEKIYEMRAKYIAK